MYRVTFLFILLWSLAVSANRENDLSILEVCKANKALFESKAECNDSFHHYPGRGRKVKASELDIASYNIFKLGTADTKFKDLALTAEMIDENWDLLALSEIQAMAADRLKWNVNFFKLENPRADKSYYQKPAYLQLLEKLRKHDKSWSLILSPAAQGGSFELYGFLYRRRVVRPEESNYCKEKPAKTVAFNRGIDFKAKNGSSKVSRRKAISPKEAFACTLRYSKAVSGNIERAPLIARFVSGDLDFHYISMHTRFRAPCSRKSDEKSKQDECRIKKWRPMLKEFENVEGLKPSVAMMGRLTRFYEIKMALKESQKMDGPVLIGGDLNLERTFDSQKKNVSQKAKDQHRALWIDTLAVREGAELFVDEKTSLTQDGQYASAYDHFIFVRDEFTKCRKIGRFDFFKDLDFKTYLEDLSRGRGRAVYRGLLEEAEDEYASRKLVDGRGRKFTMREFTGRPPKYSCEGSRVSKDTYLEAYLGQYECKVLQNDPEFIFDIPTKTYMTLLSDHVPIEMSCATKSSTAAGQNRQFWPLNP